MLLDYFHKFPYTSAQSAVCTAQIEFVSIFQKYFMLQSVMGLNFLFVFIIPQLICSTEIPLTHQPPTFTRQRATPVTVGWFASPMCKNMNK
jgi:hypothetical protein